MSSLRQKVDSTCSIDDYDPPTQAAIEKVRQTRRELWKECATKAST
jgi:hypothetical protein